MLATEDAYALADGYARAVIERAFHAADALVLPSQSYHFGPMDFRVRVHGHELTRRLEPAIRHARRPTGGGFELLAIDSSAGAFPAVPEWGLPHLSARHLERLHMSRDGALYFSINPDHAVLTAFDAQSGRGLFWCQDAGRLPYWEDGAPFKTLLHWAAARTDSAVLHAGAVTDGRRGALLVGAGGSGKSTTVAACSGAGLGVAGDDLVLVDVGAPDNPQAYALFDTIKLDQFGRSRIATFGDLPRQPAGDKAMFRISDASDRGLRSEFPIHAILYPRVAGTERTQLFPASPAEILRALAPSTVFLLRGAEERTVAKASALARRLPCWRLSLGRDPMEAADAVAGFLEGLE